MDDVPSAPGAVRCGSCGGDLEGAILMTCLHVLCRNCLPSPTSTSRNSQDHSYLCPVCCPLQPPGKNTSQDGVTSTSQIASQPCSSIEELKRKSDSRRSSSCDHHFENGDENENEEEDENEDSSNGAAGQDSFTSPLTFPCPQHSHRDAEQFCLACHQIACSKCLSSFHRKCAQHLLTFTEAVIMQRPALNSLHSKLAQKVVGGQESLRQDQTRLKSIEEQRKTLIGQITAQREALVSALVAKEQQLLEEVNVTLDKERARVEGRMEQSQRSARAAEGQLSVLEAVMSVKGEPEILPLLPSLHARLDAEASADNTSSSSATSLHLAFHVNTKLADEISKSQLGEITRGDKTEKGDNGDQRDDSDLNLTLMTSFHAQSREDTCEPLLTDLLLLPTGDVILTDRDNKCVKKFNQTGHLLTRVPIPEVPSRLALVSHGKAVISVMTKKILFFLSLLGTVRILSSVRVNKHYCFLASAGQGQGQSECQLLAATNLCDVIDLITESGVLLRRLFTHKGERVALSRPLYLHVPLHPRDPQVAALVVDSGRRLLFALTSEGETTFTFKPKDAENSLECPLGVATVPPTGLILLADRDRQRVVLLGRRGTLLKEVLGVREGLHKPCALYGGQVGRVALTQVDGWVKIYKVT